MCIRDSAETVQLFTMDPDIKTVEDLKGKSVSIGAANSGVSVSYTHLWLFWALLSRA